MFGEDDYEFFETDSLKASQKSTNNHLLAVLYSLASLNIKGSSHCVAFALQRQVCKNSCSSSAIKKQNIWCNKYNNSYVQKEERTRSSQCVR